MTRFPVDDDTSPLYPPRQLNDDVLQTAEEAVLTNPASVETIHPQADADGAMPMVSRSRFALAAYVAEKPCRSALMAMVVGAVATAALKSTWAHSRLPRRRKST